MGVDIILEETSKEDGAGPSSGMPIRQSRRIAQIKIKEEAERRKLEELTLFELKEQQRRRKHDERHETKVRLVKIGCCGRKFILFVFYSSITLRSYQ